MYADNVKLYRRIDCAEDCVALQSDVDRLSEWSRLWRLSLNPANSKSISFALRTSPFIHSYQIDGHHLERCAKIRDLGVGVHTSRLKVNLRPTRRPDDRQSNQNAPFGYAKRLNADVSLP